MTDTAPEEGEMLAWAKDYAQKNNWILNPDEKQLGTVIKGLVRNKAKFGHPYCPCRLRSGDAEKDRAIECPCIFHRDEVENQGACHCHLYYKNT